MGGRDRLRSRSPSWEETPSKSSGTGHVLRQKVSPDRVAQLVGVLYQAPKVFGFNSWSAHVPGPWVRSHVRVRTAGTRSVLLTSMSCSLSLSSMNNTSSGEDLKKKK